MEAVAKYDFKATADDELSFKRGDILKVGGAQRGQDCPLQAFSEMLVFRISVISFLQTLYRSPPPTR